jgi:predicted nucleic acid-binding protein
VPELVVVDASLALRWVISSPNYTREARALLRDWGAEQTRVVAPALFRSEASNAFRRRVLYRDISYSDARQRLEQLLIRLGELDDDPNIPLRAFEIAQELNLSKVYDAHYAALALREMCECWTADREFWEAAAAVGGQYSCIRHISEYKL